MQNLNKTFILKDVYFENIYGEMIQHEPGQRDLKGYLCYKVSINPFLITISSAYETINKINVKNKSSRKLLMKLMLKTNLVERI